jgi:hypothetical protein
MESPLLLDPSGANIVINQRFADKTGTESCTNAENLKLANQCISKV